MPAYSRDTSEWTSSIMRQQGATDWTADDALGFVRVGSEWVQFQKPIGDNLGQPINLAAIPGDLEATVTWTNDLADGVDADNVRVQYRLPGTTPVWTESDYPITAAIFEYLTENTLYQFQVRYITRDPVDGQIDGTGPISELFFTTLALAGPGTPAADPGGSGADTTWPWGNTNNPGAVDSGGCWWEYKIQVPELPLGVGVISYVDRSPAITGEFAGDAGSLELNLITLGMACGDQFRFAYREVCAGTPGAWQYSTVGFVPCDWTASCGGIPASQSFTVNAFTDAILAMPQVCLEDGTEVIEDYITMQNYGRLPGLYLPVLSDNDWELRSKLGNASTGDPLVAGFNSNLTSINSTTDFSFTAALYVSSAPPNGPGAFGFVSHRVGEDLEVRVAPDGSGWKGYVAYSTEDGLRQVLTGTSELALNVWHTITVTIDVDGDALLYVDGVEEDSVTPGSAPDWDGLGLSSKLEVYGNSLMRTRKVAAWDRVLTPEEITLIHNPVAIAPTVAYFNYVETGAVTNHSIAHASPQAGDLIVVTCRTRNGVSSDGALSTPPAGFTFVTRSRGSAMYYKVADGTETGNVTIVATPATSIATSGVAMAYIRGCDPGREFGGFWRNTAFFGEQLTGIQNSLGVNVHPPFTRNPSVEGLSLMCFVIHEAVENVIDDQTPAGSQISPDATTITNIQRAGSTGTLIDVPDVQNELNPFVTTLAFEWPTSSNSAYFWFYVQGEQTATWNSTPHIIETTVRDVQATSDKDIILSADREDGELMVAITVVPWGDITGLDGMTEELEIFRTGTTYEHVLSKVYATADGDRYTLTTSSGYTSLSLRHIVFRIRGASGAVQANGVWRSNSFPGTTVPYIDVALTPAVGDLLIAFARGVSAEAMIYNTANGFPTPGSDNLRNYIWTGGPTPDEGSAWVTKYADAAVSTNMPILQDDTTDSMSDRTGFIIAVS